MPPVITGDPDDIQLGAGSIYFAAIGTADPANVAAVTGASATWHEAGWTEDGSKITFTTTSEDIFVEEEFDSVKSAVTAVTTQIDLVLAQSTRRSFMLALNQGAGAANDDTIIEPVTPGSEQRVKIAHISDAGALFVGRRALQVGNIELNNQKAPDFKKIPVSFKLEKPAGAKPWFLKPSTDGLI